MKTTALDTSKSYIGTCQCCFGQQVVKARKGSSVLKMVHHGYNRPGTGYIVGDCRGVSEEPYELSCEATKRWLAYLVNSVLPMLEGRLAALQAGPDTIAINVENYDAPRDRLGRRPSRRIEIDRYTPEYSRYTYSSDNGFDRHLKESIASVECDIRGVKIDITRMTERVTEWKYAPEKLVEVKKEGPVKHAANPLNPGRPWCKLRQRLASIAGTPDEVTCTRCKARLAG